jgi:ABC-type iron transport system FetAB ATPase subunit
MRRPAVLLLDEPTGNLDDESSRRVEAWLAEYRRTRQAAVLWVSHDEQQAARVATRRFVLDDGKLTEIRG